MSEFNVLSLFDGMSCGQLALRRAGIKYDNYYASEVDKYAIEVTQTNFPDTIQLGDVTKVKGADLPKIDLLMGGSPCQGFSMSGKGLNFSDARSKLFFEFVRLLEECDPKYFLLENVKMKKVHRDIISSYVGVRPIQINSALVSAQNRVRLYWTNIAGVKQPEDRGILLKDIIDNNIENGSNKEPEVVCPQIRNKSKTVRSSGLKSYDRHEWDSIDDSHHHKLTTIECERLQTVPDNYTNHVSNAQRYKMLGNGWTVAVIAHILKNLYKKPRDKQPVGLFPLHEILEVNSESNSLTIKESV